jgi:hypothetical protein
MKELDEDLGDLMVARFTPAFLLDLRNGWAPRGYRAVAIRLQVLKNVLWPAIVAGKLGGGDPFALIPGMRRPRDAGEPHRMWPDAVVLTVVEAAIEVGKFGLARGVAIGRWQGPRREDIVRLTLAARRGGRFAFVTGKRKVPVDIAEDPALTAVFAATPSNHLILAPNLEGLAYTADGFAQELKKLIHPLQGREDRQRRVRRPRPAPHLRRRGGPVGLHGRRGRRRHGPFEPGQLRDLPPPGRQNQARGQRHREDRRPARTRPRTGRCKTDCKISAKSRSS